MICDKGREGMFGFEWMRKIIGIRGFYIKEIKLFLRALGTVESGVYPMGV
jgi:hypothetical protein